MNRIYKVVWSKAKNCYVVVSEYAKKQSKGCSGKKMLALVVAAGILAGSAGTAEALNVSKKTVDGTTYLIVTKEDSEDDTKLNQLISYVNNAKVSGTGSVALGVGTEATGSYSAAIGHDSKALRNYDIALGNGSLAKGGHSVAIGGGNAYGHTSVAIGNGATTGNEDDYKLSEAEAQKKSGSIAIGRWSKSRGYNSLAMGESALADEDRSMAIGIGAEALAKYSSAIGHSASAEGEWAMALGTLAKANADYSTSVGWSASTEGYGSTALGTGAKTTGERATAVGTHSKANGKLSFAAAAGTTEGERSVAFGYNAIASGFNAYALSNDAIASAKNAIAFGNKSKASQEDAVALGTQANAAGKYSLAFGYNSQAAKEGSVAIGYLSKSTRDKGDKNAYLNTKTVDITGTWISTAAPIAVGDDSAYTKVTRQITGVAAGSQDTDAVNVAQLKVVNEAIEKAKTEAAKHSTVTAGDNITVTPETKEDGSKDYKVALNKDITVDSVTAGNTVVNNDGIKIGTGTSLTNTALTIGGKTYITSNGINANGQTITNVKAGLADTDAVNVSQLKQAVAEGNTDTHIQAGEYTVDSNNTVTMDVVDKNGKKTGEVTIKDVAKASDIGDVNNFNENVKNEDGSKTTVVDAINNIDGRVTNIENNITEVSKKHSTVTAGDNIKVTESTNTAGGKDYTVALDKDITVDSVTAGKTKISNDGVAYDGKTYINGDGINANNQKVTNVAAGTISATSTDAVNGSQLYQTNQQIINNSNRISKLGDRINKVGAGAAALAALHPLDFDPDAKWDFAVGFGNYHGENAGAVGAYYRPNEDTMLSIGGTFGNGENMVNAGLSIKVGTGSSNVSTSRVAMAKEMKAMREHMAQQDKLIAKLTNGSPLTNEDIQSSMRSLFPDVPENHWAYDYVTKLAGAGYIEGYPDGSFKGDSMMTRYEFAAIIYRAMMNGAARDAALSGDGSLSKLIKEFESELEYIRVDTVHQDKNGTPTVERVRVNKENLHK